MDGFKMVGIAGGAQAAPPHQLRGKEDEAAPHSRRPTGPPLLAGAGGFGGGWTHVALVVPLDGVAALRCILGRNWARCAILLLFSVDCRHVIWLGGRREGGGGRGSLVAGGAPGQRGDTPLSHGWKLGQACACPSVLFLLRHV